MEACRLTRKVFLWDLNSGKLGTWCYDIKHVFADIDKTDMYNNRESFDLKCILKLVENVLMDVEKRKWNIELHKQTKLQTKLQT